MAHDEQLDGDAAPRGMSRRTLIFSGATLAAAGVAAGAIITSTQHDSADAGAAVAQPGGPIPDEQVVVHLLDAQSGRLQLFVGTRHVTFTDRGVADALARTAATAS